jgi:diguanylate cyclase (GGDEF)-like protein
VENTERRTPPAVDLEIVSTSAPTPATPRLALRRLVTAFGERDDPYAGADRMNAVRITALIWVLSGLITAIYLPFDPPTAELGGAGWVVAGTLIAAQLATGAVMRRRGENLSFNALLRFTFAGICVTAAMTWLAGGWGSAYSQVLLLWIGCGMGIHPPRRALAVVLAAVLASFLPYTYAGWSAGGAEHVTTELVLWILLGGIVLTLMTYVRAQRVALRDQTHAAAAQARADPLTGLGNRRAFDEILEIEIDRARSSGSALSVALLDLDGFKGLNDDLGHLEGDNCLRRVAATLERAKRAPDHVFRWGGDEFAVILSGANEGQARAAITRIARLDPPIRAGDGRTLGFSHGVARLEEGMSASELLARADLDLFAAKRHRDSLEHV